jgi:hypothetical protein
VSSWRIGGCVVAGDVDDHGPFVHTAFPDGATLVARPIDEPWEQTRLHDILHSLLAEKHGLLWPPSLWQAAHPQQPGSYPGEQLAREEAAVLRMQEVLAGVLDVDIGGGAASGGR